MKEHVVQPYAPAGELGFEPVAREHRGRPMVRRIPERVPRDDVARRRPR